MTAGEPERVVTGSGARVTVLAGVVVVCTAGFALNFASMRPIARAVNIYAGEVTNEPVAETFGLPFSPRFVA